MMKTKTLLSLLLIVPMVVQATEYLNYMKDGWRIRGRAGVQGKDHSISWTQAAPAGKDKLIILNLVLPGEVNAESLDSFKAKLKIHSKTETQVRIKLEASSLTLSGRNGYLYGTPVSVKTNGIWQDYELELHHKEPYGVHHDFMASNLTELKIVIICNNAEERFDIVLEQAELGNSRKKFMNKIKKQLSLLGKQLAAPAFRAEQRPVIDGKPDEQCWRDAVRLTDFHSNSGGGAREQTEVYLCYDRDNLYLFVKAYAGVLDPVNNLLDEFKASVMEHDGATYEPKLFIKLPKKDNYKRFGA